MNVAKSLSLVLVLFFLTSSCIVTTETVYASSATENTWGPAASLPEPISAAPAAVVNGKIYIMGGSANYEYDPVKDTWTARKPMPTPRYLFGIAACQGKIYVIGGTSNLIYTACDLNEAYDPATDSWETKQPLPTSRYRLDANVVGNKIYLVGGVIDEWLSPNSTVSLNEVYDVFNDSWSEKEPMPVASYGYSSAVCGGKIYIIDGKTQIYDPTNDSWITGAPIPTRVTAAAAAATTGETALRRIYVIGGVGPVSSDDVLDLVQVYNPGNDTWTFGARMPTARQSLAVAAANDKIFVIGGDSLHKSYLFNFLRNNEVYTPFGYGTPDPAYVFEHTPPRVLFVPSLNGTYTNSTVPLVFSVDKTVDWVGYSLDGQQNITINGNTTLTGLPSGQRNITVYTNDTFGNMGASETINFTITKKEPFPTAIVAAVSGAIVVTVVVIGLLVYIKKHNPKASLVKKT